MEHISILTFYGTLAVPNFMAFPWPDYYLKLGMHVP